MVFDPSIKAKRLLFQAEMDKKKSQEERNKFGQFATPTRLSREILEYTRSIFACEMGIRFLEPAFGTGALYEALLSTFSKRQVTHASAFEIDPDYGGAAKEVWEGFPLELTLGDFTKRKAPCDEESKFNLLVSNPPYVRHHHLSKEEKLRLQELVKKELGIGVSGLSGLYCYFLLLAHPWLQKGGISCWLVPSEFLDVAYGKSVKEYLINRVKLLKVHRFEAEDKQFQDALVSSAVLWFKNELSEPEHTVDFSVGGSILSPKKNYRAKIQDLQADTKWSFFEQKLQREKEGTERAAKLSSIFEIKRGIVTGSNSFFIMTKEQIENQNLPMEFFLPVFPSPRYVTNDTIETDRDGLPLLEKRLFVFSSALPENKIQKEHPCVWEFLIRGKEKGVHQGYICSHRSPWYYQEQRDPAPLLCTYMGRSSAKNERPFRFLLNFSRAIAPNVYLMMYPKPELRSFLQEKPSLLETIWKWLNQIPLESLAQEGRVYGGGLHKLEPKELANIPLDGLPEPFLSQSSMLPSQLSLF